MSIERLFLKYQRVEEEEEKLETLFRNKTTRLFSLLRSSILSKNIPDINDLCYWP